MNPYLIPFFLLLLYKEQTWILNWEADDKIITNSSCLNYDSSCFSTNQETIIFEARYVAADRKNPCIFPFKYANKTYNFCTRKDGTTEGYPDEKGFWCATSVDADLDVETWGFCNNLCPLEGTVRIFLEDQKCLRKFPG